MKRKVLTRAQAAAPPGAPSAPASTSSVAAMQPRWRARAAGWPGRVALFVVALAFALAARRAAAEPTTTGYALNRFQPAEAGSDWFALESLDLRGGVRPALSLTADLGYRPLVTFDADGQELVALVDGQFFYHVNAGLVLGHRLRLSASLPLLVYSQGGQAVLAELGDRRDVPVSSRDGSGLGDARFGVDLRLAGTYGGPFTMAIGARVHAATGNESRFTSDGQPRWEGRSLWAGQAAWFSWAAFTGVVVHGERDDFAGVPFGTDLSFGAALGLRLARGRVHLGPELYGHTVLSDGGDGLFRRESTPVEVLLGGKAQLARSLRLGAAAGRGLTSGLGATDFRFVAALDWSPQPESDTASPRDQPPPRDLDADGLDETADACPREPGPARPHDAGRNGCPEPRDRDHDGITDDADACADRPGVASGVAALHGCPPPDRDGDGVADTVDACPDSPGVVTLDPLRNGCPADADGDAIDDARDACPSLRGARSRDPKRHGCPRARLEQGKIRLSEQVQFAPASAQILPDSDALLEEVAQILRTHPEIELLSVEGHTDNSGSEETNLKLSRDRALAVVMRLVESGISARRLTAKGHGSSQPIADNDSPEGRQSNRRVEFELLRLRAQVQRLP